MLTVSDETGTVVVSAADVVVVFAEEGFALDTEVVALTVEPEASAIMGTVTVVSLSVTRAGVVSVTRAVVTSVVRAVVTSVAGAVISSVAGGAAVSAEVITAAVVSACTAVGQKPFPSALCW